jgi:potassium-dependent mechanosensitive channel
MPLFKFLVYCLFVYSLLGLPVNAQQLENAEDTDTVTQESIEKRQQIVTTAQMTLEKESQAVSAEEEGFEKKIADLENIDPITNTMLEEAVQKRQTANQKLEAIRLKRKTIQANLDKQTARLSERETALAAEKQSEEKNEEKISALENEVALYKQAIELEKAYLKILNTESEWALKQNLLTIEWHSQLQIFQQTRQLKKREQTIADAQATLAQKEATLQAEENELPNKVAALEISELTTVEQLKKQVDKTTLEKHSLEAAIKNLDLERQSVESNLDNQAKQIKEDEDKLQNLRKMPPVDTEKMPLHDKRLVMFEKNLALQKKALELEQQQLNLLKQRIEYAHKRLSFLSKWYEKLLPVYLVHQKQALKKQIQEEQRRYRERAAALRQKLALIPVVEENTAKRYLVSVQIQEANELDQRAMRQLKIGDFEERLELWQNLAEEQQKIQAVFQNHVDSLKKAIDEINALLSDIQGLQTLLQGKIAVLTDQDKLVNERKSILSDQALEQNTQVQALLAKLKTTLQQEYDNLSRLQDEGQTLLPVLERVYKENVSRALLRERTLPSDFAQWWTVIKEIATLPLFILQQLHHTSRGFIQAFQQTSLSAWFFIAFSLLIWFILVIGINRWATKILNSSTRNRLIEHLILFFRLWRENTLSITVTGAFLLVLWFIEPNHLSTVVTLTLFLTWLGSKLLINLSRFLLSAPEFESQNTKPLYRQLRWTIIVLAILTVITVFSHVKASGEAGLSLATQDLIDTLFMVLLSLTIPALMQARQLILAVMQNRTEDHLILVIKLVTSLLMAMILTVSVLGVIGYITLGWTVAKYLSVFLLVLTGWLLVHGLLNDLITLWKKYVSQNSAYESLWLEDIIPLVHKLLGFALFVLAGITFFWLTGWLSDVVVRDNIRQFFEFSLVTLGDGNQITVGGVLVSIFIIWAVFWLGGWSRGVSYRWVYIKITDVGLRNSLSVFTQYGVIIIGLLIALKVIGIDPTALTVFAGAIGIGVGFGLQNIVNNFVSGILLLIGRSFRVNDRIKIGSDEEMTVVEINWLDTRFLTTSGIDVTIPNSTILGSKVQNYSSVKGNIWFWPSIYVDPRHSPRYVNKILSEAMSSVDGVVEVWPILGGVNDWAAEYWACFSVKTYNDRWDVMENVWIEILEGLHEAGIELAIRRQEIYTFDGNKERKLPTGKVPPGFNPKEGKVSQNLDLDPSVDL